MIAEVYLFEQPTSTDGSISASSPQKHDLPVSISFGTGATEMGSLIGTVKAMKDCENDILSIGQVSTYAGAEVNASSSSTTRNSNSGLICNVLDSGNIYLSNKYIFPSTYTVESTTTYNDNDTSAAGNAGGVIGVMKKGTTLYIGKSIAITGTTINASGNAGGLVGLLEENAKIVTEEGATVVLTSQAITATKSAGGLVGLMQKESAIVTGSNAGITLSSPQIEGAAAGGVAGKAEDVIFADKNAETTSFTMPSGDTSIRFWLKETA